MFTLDMLRSPGEMVHNNAGTYDWLAVNMWISFNEPLDEWHVAFSLCSVARMFPLFQRLCHSMVYSVSLSRFVQLIVLRLQTR